MILRIVLGRLLAGRDAAALADLREQMTRDARTIRGLESLIVGARRVVHPVGPAGPWISVRTQAGNEDDVVMRALHGRAWRARAGVPRGRKPVHLLLAASALLALGAALVGRRRAAGLLGGAWLLGTAEFAWRRIAPGPRTPHEVVVMIATSVLIPFAAS